MIIIFPMAGLSSRFKSAGYNQPKYMLEINKDYDVFDMVVEPFLKYRDEHTFVFVCRNINGTLDFLSNKIKSKNLPNVKIIELINPTSGQAETVNIALNNINSDEPILIFNIDTFHNNFELINFNDGEYERCDGVMEVFKDNGSNWSFASVRGKYVIKTAEKDPISNLASNGLYYFRSRKIYQNAYKKYCSKKSKGMTKGERYIAPIYNQIVEDGGIVKIKKISKSDLIFCGVPEEYIDVVNYFSLNT